ncbi:ceramidase domain-containing protein [Nocardioides agariphilus]|uniref:ceramidase domain-containing protein n=1 Tax=Nocardioides agariphilus TaxID=433664 RepID=UPI0035230B61
MISVGLLVLAVQHGWLGPDVGRGAGFCEVPHDRGGPFGNWVQPANSVSNAGFVVAGLAVAWRAGRPRSLGDVLPRLRSLPTAFAVVTVLLGPASAAMHATGSAVGGRLDLLSMYLIASFAAAYALLRLVRRGVGFFYGAFLLLVTACEIVGTIDADVPVVHVAGNLGFGVLLVAAIAMEVVLWRRAVGTSVNVSAGARTDLRWGAGAVAAMVVAFAIWNLAQGPWCDPTSWIQGHGAWHLLCAAAAYLLFLLYASERVTEPLRSAAPGSRSGAPLEH